MITHPNIKINIGLNIVKKRLDGFHDIQTLFYPDYTFTDTLEIVPADNRSETLPTLCAKYGSAYNEDIIPIYLEGEDKAKLEEDGFPPLVQGLSGDGKIMITIGKEDGVNWLPMKDLTVKAYRVLEKDFNLGAVKIVLEKKSPVGAGLGGGSADAAFALKMLNNIFNLNLSLEQLANYASQIGSDCAFFIYNRPMLGCGRGDELTPYDIDLSGYEIKVIFHGEISISTQQAYANININPKAQDIKEVVSAPIDTWKHNLHNAFEAYAFKQYPDLAVLKQSLYDVGAVYASLSGSGAAIYGIFEK